MTPSEFREDLGTHKTKMNGLSCGEEIMTIYSAVFIGCQRVTDGRTDRQTDGRKDVKPIAITCFSIADARKNTKTHTHKTKPKLTGPSSPVRTVHMSVHITGYNCGTRTQSSTEQF